MTTDRPVFVFGSNLSGRHGKGAASTALKEYGAVYGQGFGPQGNSFAIPTKGWRVEHIPFDRMKPFIEEFIRYASIHVLTQFMVTRIGCGLAGYSDKDIAPLFEEAPSNCILPIQWKPYIKYPHHYKYHNQGETVEA